MTTGGSKIAITTGGPEKHGQQTAMTTGSVEIAVNTGNAETTVSACVPETAMRICWCRDSFEYW